MYCRVNKKLSLVSKRWYGHGRTSRTSCYGPVTLVNGDTQTPGVVVDGHPWIVQDGLGILGVRGYSDTGVVVDGHPWIVQDGLGILGVRGYTDIGVGDGWTSVDCPGWSGYTRTQLQGHPRNVICVGHGCLDFLGLSRIVFVCGGSCLCNLHIHSELGIVHGTW